jgi:hypothetical protein
MKTAALEGSGPGCDSMRMADDRSMSKRDVWLGGLATRKHRR